jgi:5S rRNA maturation endonuclease (ribonuclease M5)
MQTHSTTNLGPPNQHASGESNGAWGDLATPDGEFQAAWDRFDRLPEPGANAALDALVDAKGITIAALVKLGAKLSPDGELAFAYRGPGICYRALTTGNRHRRPGSTVTHMKIVQHGVERSQTCLVVEGETDGARCSIEYDCDVAIMPGVDSVPMESVVEQLEPYKQVLIGLDTDKAGNDAAAKIAEHSPNSVRFPPPANDWCAIEGEFPPLPEPPSGELDFLDELCSYVRRFIVLSDDQLATVALWVAHTHALDACEQTPYLSVRSPEKGCGKTYLLRVLSLLVAKPWPCILPSDAVVYNKIEAQCPTLLLDEVDAIFGDNRSDDHNALRGLLNGGNARGDTVDRMAGGNSTKMRAYKIFCPKALAGIGALPDTVADRSIPIVLKKKQPHETVDRLRFRLPGVREPAAALQRRMCAWATNAVPELAEAWPDLPESLGSREQDSVEPLLAIADAASGDWPRRARAALVNVIEEGKATDDESLPRRALADCREAFAAKANPELLPSAGLVNALTAIDDAPWSDYGKHGLTAYALSLLLKPYDIHPMLRSITGKKVRAYALEDFTEAWQRYLPNETTK